MGTSSETSANNIFENFFTPKSALPPILSISNSNENENIFSIMPSYKNLAIVILKYLRKMRWEFVNVVLEERVCVILNKTKNLKRKNLHYLTSL